MSFVIEKRVSAKGAITLEDNLVIAGVFDKAYLADFAKPGGGNSITIRKYATETGRIYDGVNVIYDKLEEDFITLTIDRRLYKAVELEDDELGLDVVSFDKQVGEPLFRSMSELIEEQCFEEFYKIQYTAKYFEKAPEALEDLTMLEAQSGEQNYLNTMAKIAVMDSVTAGRILSANTNQLMDASFGADGGKALRTAMLGEVAGMNILKSNKVPKKILSTVTDGTATAQIAASKVATTIAVSGLTGSDTLHKGDILVFTNGDASEVRVNVAADYVATGTGDVVNVFWVDSVIDSGAAFVVENKGFGALITEKTFASASYKQPKLNNETDFINDEKSGVSIRIQKDYKDFTHTLVLDCKFGAQLVNRELGIRYDLATDPQPVVVE